MIIILAYCDTPLADPTAYNANFATAMPVGAVGAQMQFDTLKYIPTVETETVSGKTKRGRNFEHVISTDEIYDIVITADELMTSAKRSFVTNFWKSSHKYLLTDTATGTYINVVSGGGVLPIELINESKYLQELKLNLKAANGNGIT
ncbi:MAG: hypothetical protein M9949_01755 [Candidatus Kapabacteria bacterium]|nr:hypothetical protein [Candidatus Kapabacteria bacterium]